MARRNEDFDEFCDPDYPKIIKYEDVMEVYEENSKYTEQTLLIPSNCQRKMAINLHYKLENLQRSGSFKDRGAINALLKLPLDKKKLGVVVASTGNEGLAFSYIGSKLNVPVIVVMPSVVPVSQMQKCRDYGSKVIVQGANLAEAQRYARAVARDKGLTFMNGRDHPDILVGYGSLAVEILNENPGVEALLVPVGSGGLVAAVAAVVKHVKPEVLIYGVQPETSPAFFKNLDAENSNKAVVINHPTMADNIAVNSVGVNSFATTKPLLDKMLLVKEDWIAKAIVHMYEKQRLVVEGAGACPLAAIIGSLVPEFKMKNVVAIVSGGNVNSVVYGRIVERGLAYEGRLVKFRVGIKDNTMAQAQLFQLLASSGYDLIYHFQHHKWLEGDEYFLEMNMTYRAKNLEHALQLKRIVERAYPCTVTFETEPFNDKRTCPCYVYKNICAY